MADFTEEEGVIAELETVVDSAVALIEGIAVQIDAAVAANDAGDNTQLSTLSARIRAKKDALAAAVAANTTAASEVPPPPPGDIDNPG